MRRSLCSWLVVIVFGGIALMASPVQGETAPPEAKLVSPPLEREGTYALKLLSGLELGSTDDEAEAETKLSEVGIMPRNGWIADYPLTPDVVGELQESVRKAAAAGKLGMDAEEALEVMSDINQESGQPIKPAAVSKNQGQPPQQAPPPPSETIINNYYYDQGPPVVTYYAPPADYYGLYSWVPYPFWWGSFWFGGYYILNDFHRVVVYDRRRPVFVSNHFNDVRRHRVYRVDPVERFRGRTYGGIGVRRDGRGFIQTRVPRSDRVIFNRRGVAPGVRNAPAGRGPAPAVRGAAPPSGGSIPPAVRGGAPAMGGAPPAVREGAPAQRREIPGGRFTGEGGGGPVMQGAPPAGGGGVQMPRVGGERGGGMERRQR